MLVMVKRNIKLYFRDKTSVFFSLLSIIIVFVLYLFFLGDSMINNIKSAVGVKYLMDSRIMAGILSLTGVTTTLGVLGIMVEDNADKITKDFFTSPMKRSYLAGGYALSAVIIGIIMSLFTFILAEAYIVLRGGSLLSVVNILKVLGIILISVVSSSAMMFFMVSFFQSRRAFSTASIIVGTSIGFLTGIYIPIGNLNSTIQFIIKIFPVSYTGSLFRSVMMEQAITNTFASAPSDIVDTFKYDMGVLYQMNGQTISTMLCIFLLMITAIVFYGLVVLRLSKKKMR
jgi:multidrug/hemolysin transport system permease protein